MIPPVGKSGAWMMSMSSSSVISGFSISAMQAFTVSLRLCGGMFVAMPTAIPEDPFTRRFGIPEGSTDGSVSLWSKFGSKSTVSLSMSESISSPILAILASVYLYAAAGSPSTDPKFPCPSTSGYLREKSWAILTIAS